MMSETSAFVVHVLLVISNLKLHLLYQQHDALETAMLSNRPRHFRLYDAYVANRYHFPLFCRSCSTTLPHTPPGKSIQQVAES